MHEAGIAQGIIEAIEGRIAGGQIPGKVEVVHLRVGRLMAVVPDNLRFLFGILAKGTALEGAALEIEDVPVRGRCRACGAEFEIREVDFLCPECRSPEVDLPSGNELRIEAVEVV